MNNIEITFSLYDAVNFFRQNGFKVEFRDMEVEFTDRYKKPYTETIKVWVVYNPHTEHPEFIENVFQRYIEKKKKYLFLNEENKLDLYNLFDNEN